MGRNAFPCFFLIVSLAIPLVMTGCHYGGDGEHPLDTVAQRKIALGKSTATHLATADSCLSLEAELKALAAAEIKTFFEMSASPQPVPVGAPMAPPAEVDNGNADGAGAPANGENLTNNQVAGVDEADFVKTDGKRLYVLENGALHRFDITAPGVIAAAGRLAIEGWPQAMLLDDERVLVISGMWNGFDHDGDIAIGMPFMLDERVKATLVEWPDGGSARIVQERWFDGHYLTAREIDATARIVLHGRLPNGILDTLWTYLGEHESAEAAKAAALADLDALDLDALLPRSYVRDADGNQRTLPYTENDCAGFEIPEDSNGSGVTSIVTLALNDAGAFGTQHIVSNPPVVYVSANHLFLAESAQDWWWYWWNETEDERLNIHAFDTADGGMRYAGSARAQGAPINQFALDDHEGVLRIATWTGGNRWWWTDAAVESRVYTFGIRANALEPLGELTGIAPGEQLFAARFLGDTAYLVTFLQIDPLFSIDLADPAHPSILGELEVPGFSTYLHPLENDRLLAVGVGGDESGATWQTVVSLFDVSNRSAPALLARHDLARDNSGWSWSEALYEHKAFQFESTRGLLAAPLGAARVTNGIWEWTSTLELVKVDADRLLAHGSVDHSTYFDSHDNGYFYSPDIRRSFFIDDYLYAVSSKAVTVHPASNPAVIVADALIAVD